MFAIEWSVSADNPAIHHAVNVILYAVTAALLFLTLLEYLRVNPAIPFCIALLFLAHPIHTEVVANIKGRDEILGFLFILLSMLFMNAHVRSGKLRHVGLSAAMFFLSLLSKESSIAYALTVPLTLRLLLKARAKPILVLTASMAGAALLYLVIHRAVVGSIGLPRSSIPVVDNSLVSLNDRPALQRASAVVFLGYYLRLLLFPHPLSCDYSFDSIHLAAGLGDPRFLLSLAAHLGLAAYAVLSVGSRGARSVLAWCILFYFATMSVASNLLTIIGTNLAERLLYLPSLAYVTALVFMAARLGKTDLAEAGPGFGAVMRRNSRLIGIVLALFVPYSLKTIARNADWKTDRALFDRDVKTVPQSAHMLYYHAAALTTKEALAALTPAAREPVLRRALEELRRAVGIYEPFPDAHNQLGKVYFELKDDEMAARAYERAIELGPANAEYRNNYGTCLFSLGDYAGAERCFLDAVRLQGGYADALCNLGSVYGTLGELKAGEGRTDEARGLFYKAVRYFEETIRVDPEYASAYRLIAATYRNLGREAEGARYASKYDSLTRRKK